MWGRRSRRAEAHVDSIRAAQLARSQADAVIAYVEAQQPEVDERVNRLQERVRVNHFGESLMNAMRRRPA